MGSSRHPRLTHVSLALFVLVAACSAPRPATPPPPPMLVTAEPNQVAGSEPETDTPASSQWAREGGVAARRGLDPTPEPGVEVPVVVGDPIWGDPLAPVTLVVWGDFECPFTGKLMGRLEELKAQYGGNKLRVVWRHNPLPFHKNARPASIAAETVLRLGGAIAFWKFHALAFANQRDLTPENFEAWAVLSGVKREAFRKAMERLVYEANVDRDLAMGKKVGVQGTPHSMINGVPISGAQPIEKFQQTIDNALAEAESLRQKGVPEEAVYAQLSDKHFRDIPPAPPPPPPDLTVWKVPIDGSPVRGPASALVTIVVFSDFECPFCARVAPTLSALEAKYGQQIRLVFKHNPLPMHPHSEAAAQFAIEAGAQKGEAMFWKAHDLLFANREHLEDADLEAYAKTLGLDVARVKKAITSHKHSARIEQDAELNLDVGAAGTPHFFINGRRLVGAQPIEKFQELIDEQLKPASKLIADGIKPEKVYETLQKDAQGAKPVERVVLPAPTKANPGKGAALGAPVVVQFFGDFQCAFCKREQAVLDELIKAFPGKVRVVWRHVPLPFHKDALRAAEASMEAFKQKGDAGFWALAEKLFEDQSSQGLSRESILKKAGEVGLDVVKMEAALDGHVHKAAIQADANLAARFDIRGTPTIIVGDYYVSGAQPVRTLARWVKKSLGKHEPIAAESLRKEDPKETMDIEPVQGSTAATPSTAQGPRLGAKHLIVMYAGSSRAPATITRTKDEARARAAEALQKIRAGARFEDIVSTYSDEPGAGARGGDLGLFPRNAMVKPFGDAVEALSVGQVSEIVETPFGFHVILRTQ